MEQQHEVKEDRDSVRHRFITRADFARGSQLAPRVDPAGFRADQDAAFGQELSDSYAKCGRVMHYVIHSEPSSD